MTTVFNLKTPLQNIFYTKTSSLNQKIFLILSGVILLTLAAQISIPLKPIPITLQSITVIFIGMVYGPRYGGYVIATYLLFGAYGLPLFAGAPVGVAKFFGPTGGYLIGFLPATIVSGYLAENGWGKNRISSFCAAFIGICIIFSFGVFALAQFIGWQQAFILGVLPFTISELIKLTIISFLIPYFWK